MVTGKRAYIVVGLGYGDEGKGLTTDYLCKNNNRPLVIRFNGGHQAGHTVVHEAGTRHVFSCFGSGSLRNIATFWSRFCTFSPAYLLYELESLPVSPTLYVDGLSPVVTHYDVLFNRAKEASRGATRLGSCGVGYGATIDRHFKDVIELHVADLMNLSVLTQKLRVIRQYYESKINSETSFTFDQFDHELEDANFLRYVSEINYWIGRGNVIFSSEEKIFGDNRWDTYIFEGVQGILLDQTFGNKPYITKSNTSSQNALAIIQQNCRHITIETEICYVSRSYFTRHGNGPFREIETTYQLNGKELETNVYNEHQGNLRYGHLDINLLRYAIDCDNNFSKGLKKNLVLTCLDHLPSDNIPYFENGVFREINYQLFPRLLREPFHQVLFSFHPSSEQIQSR